MQHFDNLFSNIEIVEDETSGLVKLSLTDRHGESRKTKIKNNFSGQLGLSDSAVLYSLAELVDKKLPQPPKEEVVVGMMVSGVIMAGYLALVRNSKFNYSVFEKYGQPGEALEFEEEHRGKMHYVYGLKPGDKVIIFEDEVTSGKGVADFTKFLKENGIEVLAIATVIENLNFKAGEFILKETGIDLVSLVRVRLS